MPDQLLLDLAVGRPRLPRSIRPMLARARTDPFDSDDHLFEPAWGGLRSLAFVEPDPATGALAVRFVDAAGTDVSGAFPDLGGLPDALAAPYVVLDGELVVPDGTGHADAEGMQSRLALDPARGARRRTGPAVYLAFDLLHAEGRPLFGQPLAKRRQLLRSLITPSPEVLVVPAVRADGRALFEAAASQGLPAILARHVRSPYLAGRTSRLWQSISTADRPTGASGPNMDAELDDASAGAGEAAIDAAAIDEAGVDGPAPPGDAPDRGAPRPVLALIRRLPLPFDSE